VWVVDPKTQTVTVHHPDRRATVLQSTDTLTDVELLPDFSTAVAEIFTI
jgi:Uma2 family endonuclease